MEYRTLGRSGCAVSTLALGTMTFGSEADEDASHAQLDTFVEAGGNLVDTADVYSDGASEEIIGRWLAKQPTGIRSQVVLATKGRFAMGAGPNDATLPPAPAGRAGRLAAAARGRVGRPLPGACVRPAHAARGDPAASSTTPCAPGKIAYVGLSNFTGWQVQKVVDLAEFRGLASP